MSKGGYNKLLTKLQKSNAENLRLRTEVMELQGQVVAPTDAVPPGQPEKKTTVRSWLRGVGIAAILLGGLGLMQTFFWPSVIAIYSGVLVLSVDVLFEHFESRWFKFVVYLFAALFTYSFTKYVVLHDDPMLISYLQKEHGVMVVISNFTDDDFSDVDLNLVFDPKVFSYSVTSENSSIPCSFLPPIPGRLESPMVLQGLMTVGSSEPLKMYGNFQRIRCDKLPRFSALQIDLDLRQGKGLSEYAGPVSSILVKGNYKGEFRVFKAPPTATSFMTAATQ